MFPIHAARFRATRAAPALAMFAATALLLGGCGYEIQVSQPGTATPGPLNFHVVGGKTPTPASAQVPDIAEILREYLGTPAPAVAVQGNPPAAPAAATTQVPQATAAANAQAAPSAAPAVHYDGVAAAAVAPADTRPVQAADASGAFSYPPASYLGASGSSAGVAAAAAATAQPSPAAAANAPAPAAPAPAPAPLAAPTPPPTVRQAGVHLIAGSNSFVYEGAAMPIGQVLGALNGLYSVAYVSPAGETQTLTYVPGSGAGPVILSGSVVNIVMLRSATVDLPTGTGN